MTEGCAQIKLFVGAVIPFIPPLFAKIDILERGLMQSGTMQGPYGHSLAMFAGQFSLGIPVGMGISDQGTLGEMSYNHTGALGFAYWEEAMPNMLTVSAARTAALMGFALARNAEGRWLRSHLLWRHRALARHCISRLLACSHSGSVLRRCAPCRSATPPSPPWTSCAAATCSTRSP